MTRKIWQLLFISASVQDPSEVPAPLSCSHENHNSDHRIYILPTIIYKYIPIYPSLLEQSRCFSNFLITVLYVSWYSLFGKLFYFLPSNYHLEYFMKSFFSEYSTWFNSSSLFTKLLCFSYWLLPVLGNVLHFDNDYVKYISSIMPNT